MKGGQRSVGHVCGISRTHQTTSNSHIRLVTGTVTEIGATPIGAYVEHGRIARARSSLRAVRFGLIGRFDSSACGSVTGNGGMPDGMMTTGFFGFAVRRQSSRDRLRCPPLGVVGGAGSSALSPRGVRWSHDRQTR